MYLNVCDSAILVVENAAQQCSGLRLTECGGREHHQRDYAEPTSSCRCLGNAFDCSVEKLEHSSQSYPMVPFLAGLSTIVPVIHRRVCSVLHPWLRPIRNILVLFRGSIISSSEISLDTFHLNTLNSVCPCCSHQIVSV